MKETQRSLRAYFFLAGVVGTLSGADGASKLGTVLDFLTTRQQAAVVFAVISQLALGIAWLICGATLGSALQRGARGIKQVLTASLVAIPVNCALTAVAFGLDNDRFMIAGLVGFLIALYLRANVARLAAEAAASAGVPAPLPLAKIS